MVYVSEKPLRKEVLIRIGELFISHIASIRTKPNAKLFLDNLLTESEKIMLAKRLAIIAMLHKKQSYPSISKTLKVSKTTIIKINHGVKKGEFDFIISQLQKTSKTNSSKGSSNFSIWLDIMLGMRVPPRGKGRWKFLDEIEQKKRI